MKMDRRSSEAPAEIRRQVRAPQARKGWGACEDGRLNELDEEDDPAELLDTVVPLLGVTALLIAVLVAVVLSAVVKSILSLAAR